MSGAGWAIATALLGVTAAYLARMLQFRQAWQLLVRANRQPAVPVALPQFINPNQIQEPAFSVLVAARNEAANLPQLLADLAVQQPVPGGFEVLVVDDHSTDDTAQLVQQVAAGSSFPLRLLQLALQPGAPTGKKAAIQAAVQAARAPWLLLTDADCRVPAGWVQAYAQCIAQQPAARFISGPVVLTGAGWLATLQGLELAGLVGAGAASIGRGAPTMCNGANLAYRRADFFAVQGFQGNEGIASGDDEFLLHKLHAAYPGCAWFLAAEQAIVETEAQPTLGRLLRQRVRWASKWRHYRTPAPQWLAVVVLLANLAFPVGAVAWLAGSVPAGPVLTAWALKLLGDALLLLPVLRFVQRPRWLWWLPVLQLAYAPYALLTGVAGLRGSYEWKGRQLQ